jgi:hypothetical protein
MLILQVLLFSSFVFYPLSETKASQNFPNKFQSVESFGKSESMHQKSDVQDSENIFAELRENEEDEQDEKTFALDFISASNYVSCSLIHQRFKNTCAHFNTEVISEIPDFLLHGNFRL